MFHLAGLLLLYFAPVLAKVEVAPTETGRNPRFIRFEIVHPFQSLQRPPPPKYTPISHPYLWQPSAVYTRPYFPGSNIFRRIIDWKKSLLRKPFHKPYYVVKPKYTTTASTPVLPCECGVSNPARKIVGGNEAGVNEYPWMVAICGESPCNLANQLCGGSLINNMYILTAAHCFDDSDVDLGDLVVSLGDHDLDVTTETTSVEIQVQQVIIHPDYSTTSNLNDIAIIKLMDQPMISNTIRPVCLPQNNVDLNDEDDAIVTGWGDTMFMGNATSILQEVVVSVISNGDCEVAFNPNIELEVIQVCAGGDGVDSCQGDSGGPLINEITPDSNKFELIGVVSQGNGCANTPGLYTRVNQYLNWIEQNTPGALLCAS